MDSKYLTVLTILAVLSQIHCKIRNYDDFDIEAMLGNPSRSKKFFECVRNDAACTIEDKDMKHDLTEMLVTSCADCTPLEKNKLQSLKRRAMEDPAILSLALNG
ncbi:uncharacterized protein LOC113230874 [Hyposmocoma kahamanoa]|uniref:uncharacterized protein LOC113230874 n=1 Tax=Hyposmocoma kahamanoa TaxID=1477025 RepID=UPI000E6D8427|nr:uncharacterized protein LOC113230874 [Hyposmocoma kahamanoa]